MDLLYSDEDTNPYPNFDPACPTCWYDPDYYNVTVGPNPLVAFTNTIRMILPSGARHALNANAGGMVRITNDYPYNNMRTIVRAYVEKFPGFFFSDF